MTGVKICGLKSREVLQSIAMLPIDYIGFVFAKSKRQISPQTAGEIYLDRPKTSKTMGVFVNPTLKQLESVFKQIPLNFVQLHGQESHSFCSEVKERFGCKVSKAFHLSKTSVHNQVADQLDPYSDIIDMILLDTFDPIEAGGTGRSFQWESIPPYKKYAAKKGIPLMVAGGIHTGNALTLIEHYSPDFIDVSSGVEADGEKDPAEDTKAIGKGEAR